jgi:hypothetical protein
MNPGNFDWAKSFLSSKAWSVILKDKEAEAIITFSIPQQCPGKEKIRCAEENEVLF